MYGDIETVKQDTGVTPEQLGLASEDLDDVLTEWLEQFNSEINTRLNEGEIPDKDPRKKGLDGIANRLVMKMIGYVIQMRSSPVIQLGDFNIQTVDPGQVTSGLEKILAPYQKTRVSIFSSSDIPYGELR